MFIFIYITTYIVIILSVILSHFFLRCYMQRYDRKIADYEEYWLIFFARARKAGNWKLTRQEKRMIQKPQALEAFYRISDQIERRDLELFFIVNKNRMISLGKEMRNKTMHAYYAFVLSKMRLCGKLAEGYRELIFVYLEKDESVYCRENSLKALYSMGDAQSVAKAFLLLSEKNIYHSEKLLTDGLCGFNGDFEKLSKTLMKEYARYGECYRIAVTNYLFRRNEHAFDSYLGHYLKRDISVDERCSCLRLLGKNCSQDNERILIQTLEDYQNSEGWEPAAVAASFLGNYTDEEALRSLEIALQSPNWYVRINSARSLVSTNIALGNIRSILKGEDRYAKDALRYVITN